ncbi:hypothetical protein GYMLUDRAFT_376994 [Collybiopsis luxurians FD-317 M1]|uniref:Uncharacterized protein n=1 Tax=Collybiopsis luxurians FD-317 M1 TaxID=944289 RepID=A0A0D0BQK8_9AGAR|nr:hypothetical protein GYMLUDRAFT_376994 [Collybiopsis luxurians FD-317 M1]
MRSINMLFVRCCLRVARGCCRQIRLGCREEVGEVREQGRREYGCRYWSIGGPSLGETGYDHVQFWSPSSLPRQHCSSTFLFGGRRGNVEKVSHANSFQYSNFVRSTLGFGGQHRTK